MCYTNNNNNDDDNNDDEYNDCHTYSAIPNNDEKS